MSDHSILLQIFSKQRENQYRVAGSDAEQRIAKLKKLRHYLLDHLNEACEATRQDFSKPEAETIIGELLVLISEISYSIKNLKRWMRPERRSVPLTMLGTSSHIQYEAKGCVLIIAPWNYPIALSLKPLVSAVSAGCVAIIKPSEMTPHASAFIRKVVENVFSVEEIAVIDGDANISTELLKLPFNHIFFTGSPAVGKIVMKAAAENLTSVTLELGGKSPSIVDETADISETAKRIVWAKFFNNGQTCIAPDYVLVQESVSEKLVTEMKNAIREMYNDSGNGIERSTSFARIVNEKHFNRLSGLVDEASAQGAIISEGGTRNASERYIAPTIMTEVSNGMRIMQEEIFGPILPVLRFKNLSDAIDHVNAGEKPLALYIHSKNAANIDRILHSTSSGNALVNEVLTQFGNTEIPFGGINNSGIGKSNGFYGFKEFSNAKGVMKRRFGTMKFLYPPYSKRLVGLLKKGLKWI